MDKVAAKELAEKIKMWKALAEDLEPFIRAKHKELKLASVGYARYQYQMEVGSLRAAVLAKKVEFSCAPPIKTVHGYELNGACIFTNHRKKKTVFAVRASCVVDKNGEHKTSWVLLNPHGGTRKSRTRMVARKQTPPMMTIAELEAMRDEFLLDWAKRAKHGATGDLEHQADRFLSLNEEYRRLMRFQDVLRRACASALGKAAVLEMGKEAFIGNSERVLLQASAFRYKFPYYADDDDLPVGVKSEHVGWLTISSYNWPRRLRVEIQRGDGFAVHRYFEGENLSQRAWKWLISWSPRGAVAWALEGETAEGLVRRVES